MKTNGWVGPSSGLSKAQIPASQKPQGRSLSRVLQNCGHWENRDCRVIYTFIPWRKYLPFPKGLILVLKKKKVLG